jgi:hypothetical protein
MAPSPDLRVTKAANGPPWTYSLGFTQWRFEGQVHGFDDIAPILVNRHEHDHIGSLASTPTGSFLGTAHMIHAGRLQYLMHKLSSGLKVSAFPVQPTRMPS